MNKKLSVMLAALVLASGVAVQTVSAQSADQGRGGPGGLGGPMATICSTTNYTDVAAKALGISSPELRQALVGGKSISTLASAHNVSLQTVSSAIDAARKADLDQALKDGLLTQAQYDALIARMTAMNSAAQPAAQATAQATTQAPGQDGERPDDQFGGRRGFELRVPAFNVVNREVVIATAIGVSCPDLAKAMQGGQTIAQVAATKNVQVQTVIDALVNAYKTALAADVKEGLLTQAQADGRLAQITAQASNFVNNARPQRPGNGLRGNGQPGNGQRPGKGNGQPPLAPTAAATQSS